MQINNIDILKLIYKDFFSVLISMTEIIYLKH